METYKDIFYTLHKKNGRKTVSIYIERDGTVSIHVPENMNQAAIDRLIESKRYWIYKRLTEWEELNAPKRTREYVDGESFPYLGRNYRLKIVPNQTRPLILKGDYFLLSEKAHNKDPKGTFKAFYRDKGRELLSERVTLYKSAMGVDVNKIRVMELHHRWASCSSDRNLNFHWKCLMTPLKVIDYIVVHELAHLIHPDHGALFWEEIEKVLFDYEDRKRWLRSNGVTLNL